MEWFSKVEFSLTTCIFCTKECSARESKQGRFGEHDYEKEKVRQLVFSKSATGGGGAFRTFFWRLVVGSSVTNDETTKQDASYDEDKVGSKSPSCTSDFAQQFPVCNSCLEAVAIMMRLHSELEKIQMLLIEQVDRIRATVKEAQSNSGLHAAEICQFQGRILSQGNKGTKIPFVLLEKFHSGKLTEFCFDPNVAIKQEPQEPEDAFSPCDSKMDDDAEWSPPASEAEVEDDANDELYVPVKRPVGRPRKYAVKKRGRGRSRKASGPKRPVGRPRKTFASKVADGLSQSSNVVKKLNHRLIKRKYIPVGPDERKKHYHNLYRCNLCSKTYFKKTSFLKHKRAHEEEDAALLPLDAEDLKECSVCKTEIHQAKYYEHLLSHEPTKEEDFSSKPYACTHKDCLKKFSIEENLKIHMDVDHDEISSAGCLLKIKKCDVCNLCYNSSNGLLEHFQKVHKELVRSLYFCPVCAHCYSRSENLIIHMYSHKNKDQQICFICKVVSSNRMELLSHLEQAHNLTTTGECSVCQKTFNDIYLYNSHLKTEHKREETLICSFCGKICYFHFSFMKHLSVHKRIERRTLRCETCNEAFGNNDKLSAHRIKFHNAPKIVCTICGMEFLRPSYLSLHVKVHNKESYHCQLCDKYFTQKGNLTSHNRTVHCTEKPYTCEICGFSCKMKVQLARHQAKHEKKYSCDVCGRKFSRPYALRIHSRMHTGETICCAYCGYAFHSEKSLKVHVKKYHESDNPRPLGKVQKTMTWRKMWKDIDTGIVHYAKDTKLPDQAGVTGDSTEGVTDTLLQQNQKPQTASSSSLVDIAPSISENNTVMDFLNINSIGD